MNSGKNQDGGPIAGGGGADAAQLCSDGQGNGGSGVVMIRYRLLSPSRIRNTPQPLFAMGNGPHVLTVGTSAGSARISHAKFIKGGNSCHFYECTSCPAGVKAISPYYGADTCSACVLPDQVYIVNDKACACRANEVLNSGSNTCKCVSGYQMV